VLIFRVHKGPHARETALSGKKKPRLSFSRERPRRKSTLAESATEGDVTPLKVQLLSTTESPSSGEMHRREPDLSRDSH